MKKIRLNIIYIYSKILRLNLLVIPSLGHPGTACCKHLVSKYFYLDHLTQSK